MLKKVLYFFVVAFFVVSCAKNEQFDELKKYIADSEKKIESILDYEEKIDLCRQVMLTIDNFPENSNDKSLIVYLEKAKSDWKNRAFDELKKYVADSEKRIEIIFDYEEKMYLFEKVMLAIDNFPENLTDQSFVAYLERLKYDWENRAYEYANTLGRLLDELEISMRERAVELSRARHRNTDLQEISLIEGDIINSNGYFIYVESTYKVLMRGNIWGIISYDVYVTVLGEINMRDNTIRIFEANIR